MRKKLIAQYGGIALGAVYGLLIRLLLGGRDIAEGFSPNLFSVTFVWIVPFVMGVIPMFFATTDQLKNISYTSFVPALAVLVFFLCALMTGMEDMICLVIIIAPFFLGAMIGGAIAAWLIRRYRAKKGSILGIVGLPFFAMLVENRIPQQVHTNTVMSSVVITATAPLIWKNIVRVPQIADTEYQKGFFYYAGVPRPLFAELKGDSVGGQRLGHFEGGLVFLENVRVWKPNQEMKIDISVVPSTIRNKVFDQHILSGNHFRFLDATYRIKAIGAHTAELSLTCTYQLRTGINGYASWWGKWLLRDFQDRLLEVIRNRCSPPGEMP